MGWHYAYGKHVDIQGEEYWVVEEVYTDMPVEDGSLHTTGGMKPFGESKEELLSVVAMMLSDLIVRGDEVDCGEDENVGA